MLLLTWYYDSEVCWSYDVWCKLRHESTNLITVVHHCNEWFFVHYLSTYSHLERTQWPHEMSFPTLMLGTCITIPLKTWILCFNSACLALCANRGLADTPTKEFCWICTGYRKWKDHVLTGVVEPLVIIILIIPRETKMWRNTKIIIMLLCIHFYISECIPFLFVFILPCNL